MPSGRLITNEKAYNKQIVGGRYTGKGRTNTLSKIICVVFRQTNKEIFKNQVKIFFAKVYFYITPSIIYKNV